MNYISSALRFSVPLVLLLPWNGFGNRPVSIVGNPYYLVRSALLKGFNPAVPLLPDGPVLDIGCGSAPYRELFSENTRYDCLEINHPRHDSNHHVTHRYDGRGFGIADERYDVVFSSEVLEHSFFPEELLEEAFRVLRPGGELLLSMPFFWPEHEQPHDSQRFTSFGLEARLVAVGFEMVSIAKTGPGLVALLQMVIELIERPLRAILRRVTSPILRVALHQLFRLFLVPFYTVVNVSGAVYSQLFSTRDPEIFLNLVAHARKPSVERPENDSLTEEMRQ